MPLAGVGLPGGFLAVSVFISGEGVSYSHPPGMLRVIPGPSLSLVCRQGAGGAAGAANPGGRGPAGGPGQVAKQREVLGTQPFGSSCARCAGSGWKESPPVGADPQRGDRCLREGEVCPRGLSPSSHTVMPRYL